VLSVIMSVVGIVLVMISAEALAWWIYLIWFLATLAWFARGMARNHRLMWMIDGALLLVTLFASATTIAFQLRPTLPTAAFARIYVIGDSISAGIGNEQGNTWPHIMSAEHGVQVVDLSRAGATIAAARRHVQSESFEDGLVLLEVGGNDIIGHVGADQFGKDLEALVLQVSGPGRQIVMLELPLLPFDNAYGLQQRRIASKYRIPLIPRRYFVRVLAAPNATLDGVHLSPKGQRLMAQMVWEMVGSSLRVAGP
jgi:acyl-CoA thioesterase-1